MNSKAHACMLLNLPRQLWLLSSFGAVISHDWTDPPVMVVECTEMAASRFVIANRR